MILTDTRPQSEGYFLENKTQFLGNFPLRSAIPSVKFES